MIKRRQLVVVERTRGQRQALSLIDHRLVNFGMAMALIHGRVSRKAIEIAIAVDIPDMDAFAAGQDDVEGLVVVGTEFVFDAQKLGAVDGFGGH